MNNPDGLRLGVDLGGTKIEAVLLAGDSSVVLRRRCDTPANDYDATLQAIADLVTTIETEAGVRGLPLGMGTPGAICPISGLMKNANSTCLNGRPLDRDLQALMDSPLRMANDADCLAVSEARDGAGAEHDTVFAVIIGTGVGGGVVHRRQLLRGPNAVAGEWGHNPLPWPDVGELPGPLCWCGQQGCLETWISGPALARDHRQQGGEDIAGEVIVRRAAQGDRLAQAALARYELRLGRALASIVNILDPGVIVLGGGLSRIERLYANVPDIMARYVFTQQMRTELKPAKFGDSSGVRGAAWLWPQRS